MTATVNPRIAKKIEDIKASPEIAEAIAEIKAKKELLPGICPIWHRDLQKMKVKMPSYLVDQMIGEACINVISGLPESFKSFICSEILRCCSLGIPFLDYFQTRRTKGLLIDEENSIGRSKSRLDYISYEALEIAVLAEQHIMVDELGIAEAIIKYCKANDIGVVVFDSLSSFHSADENVNSQMAKVFKRFLLIKQAGITVIIITHESKSNIKNSLYATPRGAGEIWAKCDVYLSMRTFDSDLNTISVRQLKNRDAEKLPEFTIAVHRDEDRTWFEYVGEVPKRIGKAQRTDEAIIELLIADGELYQEQIIEALKAIDGIGGETMIAGRLKELFESEKITFRVGEHGRNYYSVSTELSDE
jgi:archaellum biogenesis ATPase FlaH